MDTPKIKIKKRGRTTVTKTITKGVNDQGKRYRVVEKSVSNPVLKRTATTIKKGEGLLGLINPKKSGRTNTTEGYFGKKERVMKDNPTWGYRAAKNEQKGLIKSGKSQGKIEKKIDKELAKNLKYRTY